MVQRVAVSSTTFKVSRPGYDITSAPLTGIAFDGFSDKYNGVYMTGVASLDGSWAFEGVGAATVVATYNVFSGWSGWSVRIFGSTAYYRYVKYIPFGKTFTRPPQVLYCVRPTAGGDARAKYSYLAGDTINPVGVCFSVGTTTTHVILAVEYPSAGTGGATLNWDIAYAVLQR
jgi:hypothetical protein